LPEGYDTVLDDGGANVSAGEKQLLAIARAFLARPSVLILDEATFSGDTRTEVLVQKAMSALRSDRTSFVIAHRLSTIRDADLILVMEAGQIVEQGTHASLRLLAGLTRGSMRRSSRRQRRRFEIWFMAWAHFCQLASISLIPAAGSGGPVSSGVHSSGITVLEQKHFDPTCSRVYI
jgi:ABC-type transport system involved in cytochrome bd biosynthesis fused ATPase/permease subunit